MTEHTANRRPVVLVTGAGRRVGIAGGIVRRLGRDGWDVAFTDARADDGWFAELAGELAERGARSWSSEAADLADPRVPARLLTQVGTEFGPVSALVLSHAESVDSSILDTSVESFDRHFAVNTRANWLLIKAFAERFDGPFGAGRIVALTSDHATHNLPYGASKGALDRIVIAAAGELGHLGITANLVNPGPIDTGWMSGELRTEAAAETALGRLGTPTDTANLVAFLLSPDGGWINGQLLHSNGGFHLPF